MTNPRVLLPAVLLFFSAFTLEATSFIVPDDDELVRRADAILVGSVEGSFVIHTGSSIQTVTEIRVQQALKGELAKGSLVRVEAPGGEIGGFGLIVPGAARFTFGERVLLFLTRQGSAWSVSEMTIGKFRNAVGARGERVWVRDADAVELLDPAGKPHHDVPRFEEEFLRFLSASVRGERTQPDYFASGRNALRSATSELIPATEIAPYSPQSYTQMSGSTAGVRWNPSTMAAGVPFWKRAETDIAGAVDGGVSVIQNGSGAWNNECGSIINLVYSGQRSTPARMTSSTYFDLADGINMVEFNDPQGLIAGSFNGSGTVGVTFIVYSSSASGGFRDLIDADVVFQDGYTASHPSFPTAMTHELGHAIGFRHSNASPSSPNDSAASCNSGSEECSSNAIMYWQAISSLGYTLQTWDIHAAQAVYPGGSCGGGGGTGRKRGDFNADGRSDIFWRSSAGANLIWFMSGTSVQQGQYAPSVDPGWSLAGQGDFNGDGRADLVWQNNATRNIDIWMMNGATRISNRSYAAFPAGWQLAATGDSNADGMDDILWRNTATGANLIWFMSGSAVLQGAYAPTVSPTWTLAKSGDFNGDRNMDFVWRESSTGRIDVWIMRGSEFVSDTVYAAFPAGWQIAATGDSNADGTDDIVWRNTSTGANLLWQMSGSSVTQGRYLPSVDPSWTLAAHGDFNGDNRLDLVWRENATGRVDIWLMNGATLLSSAAYSGFSPGGWSIVAPR